MFFGINKISNVNQYYYARAQAIKDTSKEDGISYVANYAQLTDNRGTLSGWTLSVKQNGQFTSKSGHELDGATISFANATANTISDSNYPEFVQSGFTLFPEGFGESVSVMSANMNQGAGTWVYRFGENENMETTTGLILNQEGEYEEATVVQNKNISLFVPGKSVKKAERYATTLTWSLTDIPNNNLD